MGNKFLVKNESEKVCLKNYGYKDLTPVEINFDMKREINDYNQKTIREGRGTYFNLFYFNAMIEERFSRVLSQLENQYKKNLYAIEMYFNKRQVIKKEYEEMIANLEKQISTAEKDFEYVKILYDNFNVISDEHNK